MQVLPEERLQREAELGTDAMDRMMQSLHQCNNVTQMFAVKFLHFLVIPHLPGEFLDLIRALLLLLLLPNPFPLPALDCSGPCRTSTASRRSHIECQIEC